MEQIIYTSAVQNGNLYTATPIPTTETDAVFLYALEASPMTAAEPVGNSQGTLFINYNQGSLTSCDIRIYGSYKYLPTTGQWYSETVEADTGGSAALSAFFIHLTASATGTGSNSPLMYHFPIGAVRSLKVTVIGNGTASSSSLTLNVGVRVN